MVRTSLISGTLISIKTSYQAFFFDLNGVERISDAAKTGKAKQLNFLVLKGEKRGKVCGLFLSCCFPTSLSISMVDSILN